MFLSLTLFSWNHRNGASRFGVWIQRYVLSFSLHSTNQRIHTHTHTANSWQYGKEIVDNGWIEILTDLRGSSNETLHGALTAFGVGPKVADCVALFSLDATSSVPVDTHVWRIACRDYDDENGALRIVKSAERNFTSVETFSTNVFGQQNGLTVWCLQQSYLNSSLLWGYSSTWLHFQNGKMKQKARARRNVVVRRMRRRRRRRR